MPPPTLKVEDRGRFAAAGPFKYSRQQGRLALGTPETKILFYPSTEAMRRDARFPALVDSLGLTRYWASRGKLPDYRVPGLA
jgi:hypothetical protein